MAKLVPANQLFPATVTSVSPLQVTVDGATTGVNVTLGLGVAVNINQRVWCQMAGRQLMISSQAEVTTATPSASSALTLLNIMVGSLPPTGVAPRGYITSVTPTASAANWSTDLTSLGFVYGYAATACLGDNASSASQLELVASSSTLTSLVGQAWTPTGGAVSGGIRVNFTITGA